MSVNLSDLFESMEDLNYTISDESVHNILGESQTVMVYEFDHCKYFEVIQGFTRA